MTHWKGKNRHKFLLQFLLIFVCKYRKNLLSLSGISEEIKRLSKVICERHRIVIRYMESDGDHIHYMVELEPNMSISKAVSLMKGYTTYWIWKRFSSVLVRHFWKERTFWTDGYFACSIGNVSEETIRTYIENQG